MKRDPLQDILREADHAGSRLTGDSSALADRVRTTVRARRQRRRVAGTAAVVACSLALGLAFITLRPSSSRPGPVAAVTNSDPELALLRAEIAAREEIIARLLASEGAAADAATAPPPEPSLDEHSDSSPDAASELAVLGTIETQVTLERAAAVVVQLADQYASHASTKSQAVEAYQGVVTRFPDTLSADAAREGLARLLKVERQ